MITELGSKVLGVVTSLTRGFFTVCRAFFHGATSIWTSLFGTNRNPARRESEEAALRTVTDTADDTNLKFAQHRERKIRTSTARISSKYAPLLVQMTQADEMLQSHSEQAEAEPAQTQAEPAQAELLAVRPEEKKQEHYRI
jgi:hypothetical protein